MSDRDATTDVIDNSATSQVLLLTRRLAQWAKQCLAALLNDIASAQSDKLEPRAIALIGTGGVSLFVKTGGKFSDVGHPIMDAADLAGAIQKRLNKKEQRALAIQISAEKAIVHEMKLPKGAKPVLGAIIQNKFESLIPWPIENSVWGWSLKAEASDGLDVVIGAVSRKSLDPYLQALSSIGVKPVRVEIKAANSTIPSIIIEHDKLSHRTQLASILAKTMKWVTAVLVVISVIGLVLAIADYVKLQDTEARLLTMQSKLKALTQTNAISDGVVGQAQTLVTRKIHERPFVSILNELTKAIPDGSWLTSLRLSDGKLTVDGLGDSAPQILEDIEKAGQFADANFASSTQRDEKTGKDIFSITVAITPDVASP